MRTVFVRSVEARIARGNSLASAPQLLESEDSSSLMLARRSLSDRFKLQVISESLPRNESAFVGGRNDGYGD